MNARPELKNIVLVHGGFVDGSGWQGVYDQLTADGCRVAVVQNPTLSLAGDVAVTHRVLDGLDGPAVLAGRPDSADIPGPALILGSDECLNLLLPRRADAGLVTLRQKTKDGPFVKGPALPALPE